LKYRALIFSLFALSGCTTWSLEELRDAERLGSLFHKSLAQEYLEYSETEAKEYDWWASRHFADKGLQAAYGHDVAPEDVANWSVPEENRAELEKAHADLLKAMSPAALQKYPEAAARAQVSFDCWLEQQEENWQPKDIAACRETFESAMQEIREAPETAAASLTKIASYIIFFNLNRHDLNKEADAVISQVLSEIKSIKDYEVVLHGHADSSGNDEYNMELSQKRVDTVRAALLLIGIPEERIKTFAFGESDPRIPTEDRIKEQGNRRVEIFIGQ